MKNNSLYLNKIWGMFLIIVIPLFFGSCTKSFDKKIAEHIESKCQRFDETNGCLIDLQDITVFEWDSMYVFAGLTTCEDIYNALGFTFKCKHVPDNYIRILFVKGKQVVYQSQYYALSGKVQFRSYRKEDVAFLHYTKGLSRFYVLKKNKTLEKEVFYDLYPESGEREPRYR
ncbi:MAG: hypothetical protein K0B37_15410 [Bacteroidales bacterium]|nr:hypothetical protein [Bacteroidales bacterium]